MHTKSMTSKDLHLALKRDDPISYLMTRFDISTEEALFDAISNVTQEHFGWFIKELKKRRNKQKKANTKKPANSLIKEGELDITPAEEITLPEEVTAIQEVPQVEELTLSDDEETAETKEEVTSMSLDELLAYEQELSASLIMYESLHKERTKQRREYFEEMLSEKKVVQKLLEQAQIHHQVVLNLHAKCEKCLQEMQVLDTDIQVHREVLEELRNNIAELKKVVVFVYKDGTIEVEHAQMPAVSADRVKEEFDSLLSLPEAEEVTLKNVKCIARLRAMVGELPSDVEIIFDSEKLQALYSCKGGC